MSLTTDPPSIFQTSSRVLAALLAGALVALALTSCGDDDVATGAEPRDRLRVVVSTNILGEVVENLVGGEFDVVTVMPVGTDPHDFQASAQQVAQITEADVLIINGAEFEAGLLDVIEAAAAEGVPVYEAIDAVATIEFGSEPEDHDSDEHGQEDHDEHDEHGHEGVDPHFFTDPARMAAAAEGIVAFLIATVEGVDVAELEANAAAYTTELDALDAEIELIVAAIPTERRVLVTNHEVFGYFADRYGFEVVGTVVPSGTTVDAVSARELVELAEVIEHEGVPAIFADTSSSDELATTLADEVGSIAVIELFSESLGAEDSGGGTYVEMIRTNAERIADALAG